MRLYHGSRAEHLSSFDLRFLGTGIVGSRRRTPGFYFSNSAAQALYYADGSLVVVEVEGNILEVDGDHPATLAEQYYGSGYDGIVIRDCCDGDMSESGDVYFIYNTDIVRIVEVVGVEEAWENIENLA